MDLDDLLRRRRPAWERLAALTARARRAPGALTPTELDELLDLHLSVSSDLATLRGSEADPAVHAELTRVVAGSAGVVYGTSSRSRRGLRDLALVQWPAAMWELRPQLAVAATALVVPWVLLAVFVAGNAAETLPTLGDQADLQRFVEQDFVDYYTENPNPVFSALVGTNNIQVGLLAFGAGVLGGLPTLYVLVFNGLNVGVAAGILHAFDAGAVFWTSILPHGLLELSAIVASGAAGMRVGWALLVPGDRTRGDALAEEGQRAAVAMLGIVAAFVVAALVEGFVTPRSWPAWLEIGIGALALAAFALPVVARGSAAASELRATRPVAGGARVVGDAAGSAAVWRDAGRG